MKPGGRTLLAINKQSARGEAEVGAALAILEDSGQEIVLHEGGGPEALLDFIRGNAAGAQRVVIGGGDGTLNLVIDAILDCGLPLGILPMGTANDLARGLGIPTNPVEACRIIADGQTRHIDLGWVNGKHFFNVASLGASVEIARTMQRRRDRNARWGVLSYPIAMVEAARHCSPFRALLRVDGHTQDVRSYQISVGNGRFYGGGMRVAEDAALDDGTLDLYSLKVRSAWQVLLHLPALRAGRHQNWRGVLHLRGREITIQTDHPMPVNTDGELTTHTPAVFRVVPGAVPVFVPGQGGEALRAVPAKEEEGEMSVFRSDAEVAFDDVVVASKAAADHLAEAADLLADDDADLAALLRRQSAHRAAEAVDLEHHMVTMGAYPSDPDADREVVEETVRRVRDVFSSDHRRMLVDDALAETEDLATAISRALQEDLPSDALNALAATQKHVAADVNALRAVRARLATPEGED